MKHGTLTRLAVALTALLSSSCSSSTLPRCTAIHTLGRRDGGAERVGPPTRHERACFVANVESARCRPDDVYSLPEGTSLYQAGAHCWVTPERNGALCTAETLPDLMRNCDVASLSLVAPWAGDCATAAAVYGRVANGRHPAVTPPFARFILWAERVGLRGLRPEVRAALAELAERSEPTDSELWLHLFAQDCDPDDIHAWIGQVYVESIADITWVR